MKKLEKKSKLRRKNFKKKELLLKVAKGIHLNSGLSKDIRWKAQGFLDTLGESYSKTGITNRCKITISKKSFNKKFGLSRMEFFREARSGKISGVQKAVW